MIGFNHEAAAARIANISPSGWIALAACVVALMLALQTLQGRSFDYDEGVYWQSLRAMANGHSLFGFVFSSQPPLFLVSVYPFYMIFGQSLSAARLALVFFSLAGVTGTYVAGRALGHSIIGAVACLLLSLDPLYEHGAHTLQAEMPSIALQLWAVACAALAMRATGRRRGWLAAGAGVLLGCALLTKLFAIVALVPIVLYLGAPFARRWLDGDGSLSQPSWRLIQEDLRQIAPTLGLLAAGLFGVIVLILLPFVAQLGTVYDQVVRFHLAAAQTMSHPLRENLRLIDVMLFSAPLIYIAVLAVLVIALRRMWVSVPLIFWALAASVTLAQQQPLWGHHVVLLSPVLALISGCGALAAWQVFTALGRQRTGLAITLILLVLAGRAGLAVNLHHNAKAKAPTPPSELEMAMALEGVSAPDEVVLADDQYVAALANRDLPPQLVDTSSVRIVSGYLTAAQLEDFINRNRIRVVLFARGSFGLLPGFRAWVAQHYTQVATFDHDGALFLLEPKEQTPQCSGMECRLHEVVAASSSRTGAT
jgi:hypothetical protein